MQQIWFAGSSEIQPLRLQRNIIDNPQKRSAVNYLSPLDLEENASYR